MGIALFTIFAMISRPDSLAWVMACKLQSPSHVVAAAHAFFFIIICSAILHIVRAYLHSLLGGPMSLSSLLAGCTVAGLLSIPIITIEEMIARIASNKTVKRAPSPTVRKKKKRRNNNSRHKSRTNRSKQQQMASPSSKGSESDSTSSGSSHISFAADDDTLHHVTASKTTATPLPPIQQLSPSTTSSPIKPTSLPSLRRSQPKEQRRKPELIPYDSNVQLRPSSNAFSAPKRTENDVHKLSCNTNRHPETVSVPNIDGGFADDQSCESSLSLPSLGNGSSTVSSEQLPEKGPRHKKQRKPKVNQKNAGVTNRHQEKQQHQEQKTKSQKSDLAVAKKTFFVEPIVGTTSQFVPSSRWDALKPSTPPGSVSRPKADLRPHSNQPRHPSPRSHHTPRGKEHQHSNQHAARNSHQTPRSNVNPRRGGKKNRSDLNSSSRHKSTSPTIKPTPPPTKRITQKSLTTPTAAPPSNNSNNFSTPTMTPLPPPPGLTRATPMDDFFDHPNTPSPFESSLMIPSDSSPALTAPYRPQTHHHPNVLPSSSPFDPSELDWTTSTAPSPRYSVTEDLYGVVKENPFEDSQIEADLKELGGQMAGSILDF